MHTLLSGVLEEAWQGVALSPFLKEQREEPPRNGQGCSPPDTGVPGVPSSVRPVLQVLPQGRLHCECGQGPESRQKAVDLFSLCSLQPFSSAPSWQRLTELMAKQRRALHRAAGEGKLGLGDDHKCFGCLLGIYTAPIILQAACWVAGEAETSFPVLRDAVW